MDDESQPPRGPGSESSKRIYIGNLPPNATRADIENHFDTHGTGKIHEIKLMSGFGFIEYADALDARDVVPNLNGTDFMGQRLTVQFARGGREREREPRGAGFYGGDRDRTGPRTRRTIFRMNMSGLPQDTSWQDLKDFTRMDGLDVVYSEIPRERDGTGFVEYETEADLKAAVDKIDQSDFKGQTILCTAAIQAERPRDGPGGGRYRSRSPPPYRSRGYGGGPPRRDYDDYDRRGPPRPYSDSRGYRDRSPPRRSGGGYYEDRGYGGGRSPPPRTRGPPPGDEYAPPRGAERRPGYPADDYPPPSRSYGSRAAPPYEAEPYANGSRGGGGGGYPASPPPPRRRSPGRGGYGDSGYDRAPRYW